MAANPATNAEVLKKILEQFSTKELIQLSLVNKLWNYEARSVMRKRGNIRANIDLGGYREHYEPCAKLVAFASDLEIMRVVPFSGIHIDMSHYSDCQLNSNESLDPSYKLILDRLPWKHFSVNFCDGWDDCNDCPALLFVKQTLEDYCEVLEELTLGYGKETFLQTIFKHRSLPSFKILTVDKGNSSTVDEPLTSAFIKSLVSRAPNLQELRVKGELNFMENVLEGSSAVLVPCNAFRPLFEPICQSLISSVRAHRMEFHIQNQEIDQESLSTFIPKLLEASRTTLNTLIMDLLFAVPLMCYGICLENVITLVVHMNWCTLDQIEQPVLEILRSMNFTPLFPNLNHVTILEDYENDCDLSPAVVSAFVERGNAVLSTAFPDRAVNIKLLNLYQFYSIQESTLSLLAQIFPHVKTVDMNSTPECLFHVLREHFLCLEQVTESDDPLYF